MRRMNTVAAATTIALGIVAGLSGPVAAQVTAFEGARVIIGDGRAPIQNATVVVNGARITAVGPAASVQVPAGATRVNLAGKTMMPMIIDTHVHLSTNREGVIRDLRQRAYYGISAAQSMGSDMGDLLPMRAETFPGAGKYLSAGRGITGREPGRTTVPHWVTTDAEARAAVRDNAAKKVDLIKIWVDDRDNTVVKLTPALYGAVIDEAHKNNLRTIVHIFDLDDAKGTLRAGVDAFAHGVRDRDVDDELVNMVKAKPNLVLNPNLPDRGVKTDITWLRAGMPAADYAKLEMENVDDPKMQAFHAIQSRNLGKMNAAGVKIVVGTDGNVPYAPHIEMENMVLAGMTPMQVLVSANKNAAEFIRAPDMGTIEVGKSADLLILDANPLDDIKNTRRINSVYLRGQAINRTTRP